MDEAKTELNLSFDDLSVKTLDGTTVPTIDIIKQIIAPVIHTQAKDIALVDVALKVYNLEPVKVTAETIEKIIALFADNTTVAAFVRKAIIDKLNKDLTILKK